MSCSRERLIPPWLLLKLDQIVPDRLQPRKLFEPGAISQLAESVKKLGVQVPLIVYAMDGKYGLLDGERRWRAAKLAGLAEVPVAVLAERPSLAKLRIFQHSLDAHRAPLTAMERSNLLAEIARENHWSIGELAAELSIPQPTVTKLIACQKLAPEVQSMLDAGELDLERAYLVSQVESADGQFALAKEAPRLSREQLRATIKRPGSSPKAGRSVFPLSCGLSVTIKGREANLEEVIDAVAQVLKELRKGLTQGLDIATAQRVLKDKAKVKA
jgi:ParB family chromosome partitioning protein